MLAFLHIMKTAGTTVNYILRRSFGLHHCDVHPLKKESPFFSAEDFLDLRRLYPTIASISSRELRVYSDLKKVIPDIRFFTFLRDPISRTASHFQYQLQHNKKNLSFEHWIHQEDIQNYQTTRIASGGDLEVAKTMLRERFLFVGLVENFDESLILLNSRCQYQLNICCQRKNEAPNNLIKNKILNDPKARRLLEMANNVDLLLYDFVKNELYPTYRLQYGPTLEMDVAAMRDRNIISGLNFNLPLHFLKRRLVYTPHLYYSRGWGESWQSFKKVLARAF